MTTHLIPPRPDPIFTDASTTHASKSSSSPTSSSTFTPPPPATTDTDPNNTIEFNTSDYTISSRRRRRRAPCLELADGARLATELVSKAMALLVCCVLLTVTMSKDRREAIDNQKRRSHTSNSSSTTSSSTTSSSSYPSTSASFDPSSSCSHSAFTPSTPKKSSHSPRPPSPSTSESGDRSASPPYTPNSHPHPHASKPHVGQGSLDASSLPRRSKPTYYETLLVATTATSSEIKAAHRRLAIRYHPDKSSSNGRTLHALTPAQSQAMFIQVQEAYEVLSNPTERRRYDYALAHRMRYRKLANGSSIIEPSDDGSCRPVTPSPSSSSSSMGHGLGGFAGSFSSFGSWYATSAATSRNTSRASTRTHSRRDSFDEAQWSHTTTNGSAPNSNSSASSSSASASSSSSPHSHRHRSIYLALPLALLSVFVLRPLRAFGIRARIRRAKSMVYSRVMYYLQPAFRVWSFIQRVRRWSMIQWITSTISFGTFIALYIPVSCLCWINERKRRVRKIIFGRSNETEQSAGSTTSRSAHPPKYPQSPPSHAHPSTSPSPTSSSNTYFFYPRPSAPYSSILLSREVPADSTSSETSSPSMSTSSSASSMSSVDSVEPSPPCSSSHPSASSVPTLGASSNLTGRSLSESEYEASDEEWNTATLNGEKSQIEDSSTTTTTTTAARMKKSRSMPFALQLNDNKFTFE